MKTIVALMVLAGTAGAAMAAPFTAGNLLIYRVGDGSAGLVNTGAAVFVDEFTPAGTLVQSVAMPTTVSGANQRLIASGTASSEGLITVSADGQYVALTGYNRALGGTGTLNSTTGANVNRVVGIITSATGVVNTSTALADFADGNNPRSAVTTNGTDIWLAGGTGGIRYTTLGSTTSTQIANTVLNNRQVNIFNGQLYSSDSSGTAVRLGTVGTGLPTTTGQTITNLPGFPITGSQYGFFFADLSSSVAGVDTLYVADDTNTSGVGGILKYSLVGGTWVANGIAGAFGDAYRGLTGVVTPSGVQLFATRKGGSAAAGGGELVSLLDSTGYNAAIGSPTITSLATAGANTAFRGVAYIPVPTPGSAMLVGLAGLAAARRRR
jgi:hypothetical protein